MSQTTLETAAASPLATLITVSYNGSVGARYCRWTDNITIGSEVFTAAPELHIEFEKPQNGGTEDAPASLSIRADRVPFDSLTNLFPHAKVTVLIEEVDPLATATRREIFYGTIDETSMKSAYYGLCKNTIVSIKNRFTRNAGYQALSTCPWIFGNTNSSPCGKILSTLTKTGTSSLTYGADQPNHIRVTFSVAPDMTALRWKRGYISYGGLRIMIRKLYEVQSTTRAVFDLARIPPASWHGKTVSVVPGCDKQIDTCRYWENEAKFGGCGYGMPSYNPVYEKSPT